MRSIHEGSSKHSRGGSARETPRVRVGQGHEMNTGRFLSSRGSLMPVAVAVTTAITCASGRCLGGCWGCRGTRVGGFIILLSLGCVT